MFVRGGATFANMARLSAAGFPCLDRPRILDRRRRLSDRPRRLCRDGARHLEGLPRGPPLLRAATGEIAATKSSAGRSCIAGRRDSANISLRTTPTRCASAGNPRPHRLGRPAGPPGAPAPLYDPEELLGIVPVDYRKPYDVREVIARLVDGSEVLDFKPSTVPRPSAPTRRSKGARSASSATTARSTGRLEQGRPVHPALLSGRPADRLPAEHDRLSGRRRGGKLGYRQARLEDDPGRHQRQRAEADAADRRVVRRRPLRHVRAGVRPALPLLLAERARRGDGRRAGGQGDGDRRRGGGERSGTAVRRRKNQALRARRSSRATTASRLRSSPPRDSGTTA